MNNSKPDNIVFDEESNRYDASLKPYATNVGAPAIKVGNTALWKNQHIQKANHLFEAKHNELKLSFENMMRQFEYNNMVYNAKFNFEPVNGKIYHLYRDKNKFPFLSIIPPHECNFDFVNSFRLNADMIWEIILDQKI